MRLSCPKEALGGTVAIYKNRYDLIDVASRPSKNHIESSCCCGLQLGILQLRRSTSQSIDLIFSYPHSWIAHQSQTLDH